MRKIAYILSFVFPKYTRRALTNFSFVLLSTVFGLGSFTMVIPFLGILFKSTEPVTEMLPWELNFDTLKHNLYYYLSEWSASDPVKSLAYVSLLVIILVFLKTAFLYLAKYHLAPLRTGVVRDIRNKIYQKIVRLPLGFFSHERKGDIISRTTADVQEVEISVIGSLAIIFKDPISILLSVGLLLSMSVKLTLVSFLVLPVAGYLIGVIGKSLRRKSARAQNKLGELLSIIEETLGGIRIIHAFNAEKRAESRFEAQNEHYTGLMNKLWRRRDLAVPVSEFLATSAIVFILVYGGTRVLTGSLDMPPEDFFAFIIVFSQIIQPAKDLSNAWYSIQKGMASMDRIDKILYAEEKISEKENALPIKGFDKQIEWKDVSFSYGNDWVLKNINLTLTKGKVIALVGQSGSGKSTLVDLLPRFYDLEQGAIEIDGIDIRDYRLHELRALFGIVNQESILFNDSIAENIAFGVEHAEREEIIQAAKIANAHEFILETPDGYDTNIGDRGGKLSGGQRQRLSIARAVLANPQVLILDEATSALDSESERLVQSALSRLMENRTAIIIAHRLSTIVNADEICVLHEGEIIERGTHDELLQKNGAYKKLHDFQYFS